MVDSVRAVSTGQLSSTPEKPSVIVRPGESLASIAQRHQVQIADLLQANPHIKDPSTVSAGQEIRIPPDAARSQATAPLTHGGLDDSSPVPSADAMAGRRFEHAIDGQVREAEIRRHLPLEQDSQQARETPPAPAVPNLESRMEAAGMRDIHHPPTDSELRTYHTRHAPAHDLIQQGRYREAAQMYRQLSVRSGNEALIPLYETTARQLDFTQRMRDAGVRDLQFPPTRANAVDYFRTLRDDPAGRVERNFEEYTNAFFVHHGREGTLEYDPETHRVGGESYTSHTPEDWADITDSRRLRSDGRREIDCEGYAMLGQQLYTAAGFERGRFVATHRRDDPLTAQDESAVGHIMYTAERPTPGRRGETDVAVVSNHDVFTEHATDRSDVVSARQRALERAYPALARGAIHAEAQESWRAGYRLERGE